MSIVLQSSWDSKFPLPDSVKEELPVWKENVRFLNGRPIGRHPSGTRTIVYSDASDSVASFRRFKVVFLVFAKSCLDVRSSGLPITAIFPPLFATGV